MTSHTQEPWCYQETASIGDEIGFNIFRVVTGDAAAGPDPNESFKNIEWIASTFGDNAEEDARRICAAINACADIPTAVLEQGVVAEMRTDLAMAKDTLRQSKKVLKHVLGALDVMTEEGVVAEGSYRYVADFVAKLEAWEKDNG